MTRALLVSVSLLTLGIASPALAQTRPPPLQPTNQAALRGLLCKLWDLNLTVLAVRRIETGDREDGEHD